MRATSHWPTLPLADWPRRDREAWQAAQTTPALLDPGGVAATLAPATRVTMEHLYGQVLHWLHQRGELDPDAGPAERITPARFAAFVTQRRATVSDNTLFNNLRMIAMMLHCLAPSSDWRWLYRHALAPRRHEASAARRAVPLVEPGVTFLRLCARIEDVLAEPVTKPNAIGLRDLLMVALTATTALRRRNIMALTLGDSLLRHRHGYEIRFPAHAVKNARAIALLVMAELTVPLDRYVELYRPLLFGRHARDNPALWISHEGSRLSEISAHFAFRRVTSAVLGRHVHPHAFRHSAATALLLDQPHDLATASGALAHKDPTTLNRFYDLSGDTAAQAEWNRLIGKFRQRADQG